MKKRFSFENLIAEKRAFGLSEKETLFFSMRSVMQNAVHPVWVDTLSELEPLMVDHEYYIALNIVTSKEL